MTISADVAEIGGVIGEGIFYGIFLTLSVVAAYFYIIQRRRMRVLAPMIVTVIVMISLATAKLAVDGRNITVAFVKYETRAERIAYLSDVSNPLAAVKHAVIVCLLFIGNVFMTYRCYLVLNNQVWLVSIPLSITLASAGCGIGAIYSMQNSAKFSAYTQYNWTVAFYALSLAAHAVATFLAAFRIYRAEQENRLVDSRIPSFMPIIRMVVKSGIMNTLYLLLIIITFVVGSNAVLTLTDMAAPVEGTIFIIVIIRAALNSQRQAAQEMAATSNSVMQFKSRRGYGEGPDSSEQSLGIIVERTVNR